MNKYILHEWCIQNDFVHNTISKANGIFFWDNTGKKYFDMSSQFVNLNLGYNNQNVINAIIKQANSLPYIGSSFYLDIRIQAARKIIDIAPKNMSKVFFTNSGAESIENSIKISKQFSGKNKIISTYNSYHGASYGAANLSGESRRFAVEPGIPGFIKFFNPNKYRPFCEKLTEPELTNLHLKYLEELIISENNEDIAAIFLESIIGSNGVIIPPYGYLKGIRKLCDKYNILMVCDEVMTGFGRTGKWFAFEHWGIQPDIITIAKSITAGYIPFGGVIVSEKIENYFNTNFLSCGLTNNSHPIGCAATVAAISEYNNKKLINNSKNLGDILTLSLKELKSKYSCIGDVRSIGLFGGIEFVNSPEKKDPITIKNLDTKQSMKFILKILKENGIWTFFKNNVLIIAPPLIIRQQELQESLQIIDKVISKI